MGAWRREHGRQAGRAQAAQAAAAPDYGAGRAAAGAEVIIGAEGPTILWYGADPDELWLLAQTLMDGARAARNGDDINEVARYEWDRRGGRPEPD